MESPGGRSREDNENAHDGENVTVLTPMSQPVGERVTFPPSARPRI